MEIGYCVEDAISWGFAQGESNSPRNGSVESRGEVSGEESQPQISPRGVHELFALGSY